MSPVQVVVVGTEPGGRGGIGQSLPTVIGALRDRDALAGVLVTHRSYPHQRIQPAIQALVALPAAVRRIHRGGHRSVVWAHIGGPVCLARMAPLLRVARTLGATVWVHLHSAALDPWMTGLRMHAVRAALAPVDRVFVPTQHAADRCRAAGLQSVRAWAPAFPPAVRTALERVPVVSRRRSRLRLVAVSRWVAGKGLLELLDAIALGPHHLTLVGDGPLRDALTEHISARGLTHRVHLTGWVDDVQSHLDDADVFVLPSTHDTYGLAVAHALASGTPCVVAQTPVVNEVWSPVVAAVPPTADALHTAIASLRTGRRSVAIAGQQHVAQAHSAWLDTLDDRLRSETGH